MSPLAAQRKAIPSFVRKEIVEKWLNRIEKYGLRQFDDSI